MFTIAVCDDTPQILTEVSSYCEQMMKGEKAEYKCLLFSSGEEVLEYCENIGTGRIDLLFLDIELPGIDGLSLKNRLCRETKVWRIVFLSSHTEGMADAFGIKTVGFLGKPVRQEMLSSKLKAVYNEFLDQQFLRLPGTSPQETRVFCWDEIVYFEAEGNYTKAYFYNEEGTDVDSLLLTRKIGEVEKDLSGKSIVRVHRSYIVNLENVKDLNEKILFKNLDVTVPIGRRNREHVRKIYMDYLIQKAKERL